MAKSPKDDKATPAHEADDARAAILSRRAKFVAVAMAGIACGKTTGVSGDAGLPVQCLNIQPTVVDAAPPPEPCLSIWPIPEDAGTQIEPTPTPSTTTTTTVKTPPKHDAGAPKPCLSPPRPCLKMQPPRSGGDDPF